MLTDLLKKPGGGGGKVNKVEDGTAGIEPGGGHLAREATGVVSTNLRVRQWGKQFQKMDQRGQRKSVYRPQGTKGGENRITKGSNL